MKPHFTYKGDFRIAGQNVDHWPKGVRLINPSNGTMALVSGFDNLSEGAVREVTSSIQTNLLYWDFNTKTLSKFQIGKPVLIELSRFPPFEKNMDPTLYPNQKDSIWVSTSNSLWVGLRPRMIINRSDYRKIPDNLWALIEEAQSRPSWTEVIDKLIAHGGRVYKSFYRLKNYSFRD